MKPLFNAGHIPLKPIRTALLTCSVPKAFLAAVRRCQPIRPLIFIPLYGQHHAGTPIRWPTPCRATASQLIFLGTAVRSWAAYLDLAVGQRTHASDFRLRQHAGVLPPPATRGMIY